MAEVQDICPDLVNGNVLGKRSFNISKRNSFNSKHTVLRSIHSNCGKDR